MVLASSWINDLLVPGAGVGAQPLRTSMFVSALVIAEQLAAFQVGFAASVVADASWRQMPHRQAGLRCFDAPLDKRFVGSIGIVANVCHGISLSRLGR